MKLTKLRAAILALGVAALATPAFAQSSPSAPTGSETPRNQAPKGNVGTSSQQQSGGTGMTTQSDRGTKVGSKKSRSHHASRHHRRHSISTTGMGGSAHRPGNPNNGGPAEGIRNEAPKGNVSGNKMPSR